MKTPHRESRRSSRRRFVASLGAGASGMMLWPACLRGNEAKLPSLSFIVVSDTHLGYKDRESAARQWEKTAAEVTKAPGDFVLHLGDVVDGGREAQYPVYLAARKAIQKPVYEIPGNHDPAKLFEKYLRKPIDTVVDHKWLRLLLMNNARTDSHDGFLSPDQLKWIDRECRDAAKGDRFLLLCMHVPAHKNLHPDRGWYVKPEHGQKELYEILKRHNRVLALFHGHFHNGIRGWNDHGPVHEICMPSALYNLNRKLEEQKAPGYNVQEFRPGYTLVNIKSGVMTLRYKPLGVEDTVKKECRIVQVPAKEM